MKKILVFVTSLDGKITHWGASSVRAWSSEEDQYYYKEIWDNSKLTVMGSSTFVAEPKKANPAHHLVVMTRTPAKYKDLEVIGQLEFTNQSPAQLVAHYEELGLKQMIIVGGPHIATSFFKAQLIDELWLTIEPKIFGTGGNFVINENIDIDLQLIDVERVNERGTLITKYAVMR